MDGRKVNIGIATGLGNARKLVEKLKSKELTLDFVEVMACPGGCVGGGGQPIVDGMELAQVRAQEIYHLDDIASYKSSYENPQIIDLYDNYLGEPCGEKSHHLLHTH